MANSLYLNDSYITKFDLVNYAFAKLVVAWLYKVDYYVHLFQKKRPSKPSFPQECHDSTKMQIQRAKMGRTDTLVIR